MGYWPMDSPEECETNCLSMEGCNGFTWIKDVPENGGNAKLCFAKTGDIKIIGAGKFVLALIPCP